MQRKTSLIEGEHYHLYNRGVDKRKIFNSPSDYKRFLMLLYLANGDERVHIANVLKTKSYSELFSCDRGKPLVAIGAFCLMPNHFHILATPLVKDGLTKLMLKLQTGYSMYFNTKHERNGSLFQGPFKSEHVDDDTYLKYLFSYIHLNPAKLKDSNWKEGSRTKRSSIRKFVEEYPYSSLGAYTRGIHTITDPSKFPEYFSSNKELDTHLTDWLNIKDYP